MEKRYFSLRQARVLLPKIKPVLRKIMKHHVKLVLQNNMSVHFDDAFEDMRQSVIEAKEWHATQKEYFELLQQLIDWGIFVKDPAIGLIDFFSLYEGREIFLCYKYPEATITHWHELEEGFLQRKSVGELEQHQEKST